VALWLRWRYALSPGGWPRTATAGQARGLNGYGLLGHGKALAMEPMMTNLLAGWIGMLLGILSGAILGLFFHRESFAGGYASWPRRMMRLGHISFFGIGLLNLLFALTAPHLPIAADAWGNSPGYVTAGLSLVVALVAMPLCCFAAAAWKPIRWLFFIPVLLATVGVAWPVVALFDKLN